MSCDLHNHSTCSDGSVPIQRLPGIAARTGLHAIAISDHDTTLSAAYCYAHPRQEGVELIPAVELTGYDFERQHRVHLLCYYPNLDCVPLREHCEIMKQRRNACGLQTVHELEAMYPQFTEELVWETAAESGVTSGRSERLVNGTICRFAICFFSSAALRQASGTSSPISRRSV